MSSIRSLTVSLTCLAATVAACGGSGASSEASGAPGADGGATSAPPDGGTNADGSIAKGDGGSADGGGDASTIPLGAKIDNPGKSDWTWVPFADAHCMDGSSTGIGVSFGTDPNAKTVIFFDGGGACFNESTCGVGKSSYASSDLASFSTGAGTQGIFDRTDTANGVKDWNFVYIPYCTGDIHAGNQPVGVVPGVTGTKEFVGYTNVQKYLSRVVPTFSGASQILLTGSSAGGFGAAMNYDQVASAFASTPVDLVDDSGPFMSNTYVPACLQTTWRTLWNLDSTVIADCGADCSDKTNYLFEYGAHVVKSHPARKFGLLDSTGDIIIRQYFGWGADNCTTTSAVALSAQDYEAGLLDIRTKLASSPNYGGFYFDSIQHTSLIVGYDMRTAGTTSLTSWVSGITTGTITNAGP